MEEEPPSTAYTAEAEELADNIETSVHQLAAVCDRVIQVEEYMKTNSLVGGSKEFKYADEMLTQALLQLDSIPTYGVSKVRSYRKGIVLEVQKLAAVLDHIRDNRYPPVTQYTNYSRHNTGTSSKKKG